MKRYSEKKESILLTSKWKVVEYCTLFQINSLLLKHYYDSYCIWIRSVD